MSDELRSPRHQVVRQILVERRLKSGLSQDELASRLGVSQSTVSEIERGDKRVSLLLFLDYAEALGFDARSAVRRILAAKRR